MRKSLLLLCGGVFLACASGIGAAQQTKPELPEELRILPDSNPMPTMEVITVRKAAPTPQPGLMVTTMKTYLLDGYGIRESRLFGAPSWLGSQWWVVNGKPSDELRIAMKTMPPQQFWVVSQMLRRSTLADLFKMKVHIETRQMQYFELVPAKGGLKIKEVPAFVPPPPGTPFKPLTPSEPLRPGMMTMQRKDGQFVLNARAITMQTLVNMLKGSQETDGKPIVNKTGFTGSFDVVDLPWGSMLSSVDAAAAPSGAATPGGDVEPVSIFTSLQEMFGLKLVATKGPVEVVVIDSIEQPTEN